MGMHACMKMDREHTYIHRIHRTTTLYYLVTSHSVLCGSNKDASLAAWHVVGWGMARGWLGDGTWLVGWGMGAGGG